MAQAAATRSFGERIKWDERIKPALITLVIAGLAYLVGTYMVAPRMAAQQPTYVPASFVAMPLGAVTVMHEGGGSSLLPVRIADTTTHRGVGFKAVGSQALDNQFLLYVLTRETTSRTSYVVADFRDAVQFAAIDATGTVVSITDVPVGTERASIGERHQWLLVAKAGTLERFGVTIGSAIDPAGITKF